jgi:hypothetical protein
LQKIYGSDPEAEVYSPAKIVSSTLEVIKGTLTQAHFDVLRGAIELEHTHQQAALYAVVERLQPETGEPRSGRCAELLRLHVHQDPPDLENLARDGSWRYK